MWSRVSIGGLLLVFAANFSTGIVGQSAIDERVRRDLGDVFPDATSFSAKQGDPPHVKAFKDGTLVGLVFYTTDCEPYERGYKGPINILVGMTLAGEITNVKLIEEDEPYGYFSIQTRGFISQFKGKSILDRFRYGRDVDAISRATVTVASAARGIRNSGRRVIRQHLAESADQ